MSLFLAPEMGDDGPDEVEHKASRSQNTKRFQFSHEPNQDANRTSYFGSGQPWQP